MPLHLQVQGDPQFPRSKFKMCTHTYLERQSLKRPRVRIHRLSRRCSTDTVGKDLEMKNLKLYLENRSIIEENEKLRKKAIILRHENLALKIKLQKNLALIENHTSSSPLQVHGR